MAITAVKVAALIEKFGRSAFHIVQNATPTISARPWIVDTEGEGGETVTAIKAVFSNYEAEDVDGSNVLREDKRVLVAGNVEGMKESDLIREGSDDWRIMNVTTIEPGAEKLLFIVQVRK